MASIAEILQAQGARAADSRRRLGEIQSGMWSNLGQIASGAILQHAQEKADQPRRDEETRIRGLQLKGLEAEDAARDAAGSRETGFRQTMGSGRGRQAVLESLKGDPELYERALKHYDTIDTSYKKYLGDVAAGVRAFDDSPDAALAAIDELIAQGFDERQMEQYRGAIQQNPQSVTQLIDTLLQNSPDEAHRKMVRPKKEPEAFTLSEGQTRFGPDGKPLANVPKPPEPPKFREVVVKGPNGRPVKKLVPESELMQGVEQYEAPRESAQPSFQSKEVLGDDGRTTMANYDSRTGRWIDPSGKPIQNPRPVPSAMETQDARKFKQADPILRSVTELSERINTQQGAIAKISGETEKAKARINLNDDVAEYEALISGFTPLVARALGHTGVLTQQDVDSVKALFPKPGDSKSLRDRKITRIKSIIGELEGTANPAGPVIDGPVDKVWDPKTRTFKKAGG